MVPVSGLTNRTGALIGINNIKQRGTVLHLILEMLVQLSPLIRSSYYKGHGGGWRYSHTV